MSDSYLGKQMPQNEDCEKINLFNLSGRNSKDNLITVHKHFHRKKLSDTEGSLI